jgi:hypothetical protein
MEFINVLYDKGINHIKDKTTSLSRCDHNQMNQHDYFAKGLWPFFQSS